MTEFQVKYRMFRRMGWSQQGAVNMALFYTEEPRF